ncbi:MBL fold metallo-hydrolase [Streptomyces sp. NPDC001089]
MTAQPAPAELRRLGSLTIRFLPDGVIRAHPGHAYPQHAHLAQAPDLDLLDDHGQLLLSVGALLVESPDFRVLIDAGIGPRTVATPSPDPVIPAGAMTGGELLESLATVGLVPSDIDAVLLSHLHADHVGWITPDDTGTQATFPNAEYLMGEDEFAFWGRAENASRLTAPTKRQYDVIGSRRRDLRNGDSPLPGITALLTPGHTPGHTSFILDSGNGERAIVIGDAMHTTAEMAHPDMCWTGDLDPQTAIASRHALVAQLAKPGTYAIGPHFTGTVFPNA